MKTTFIFNNETLHHEVIEKLYIYENGEVIAELRELQEQKIKDNKISSVYDGNIEKAFINSDVKKANKLNLNRKDNFYIKNPEYTYKIDKAYVLYIHSSNIIFKNIGEVLATEFNHEKNYLMAYKIAFPKVILKRNIIEKIPMNDYKNYTLQENEKFSETCYGSDKEHACIWYYEHEKNSFFCKRHPEKAGEKGIIKRYFENEEKENESIIFVKPYYTKCIKDEYRLNAEKISEKFNSLGVKTSFYDIDKLLQNGVKIEF